LRLTDLELFRDYNLLVAATAKMSGGHGLQVELAERTIHGNLMVERRRGRHCGIILHTGLE
jgi:hypothetical protein